MTPDDTPVDKYKNLLGPGYERVILLRIRRKNVKEVRDKLDGSYTIEASNVAHEDLKQEIEV